MGAAAWLALSLSTLPAMAQPSPDATSRSGVPAAPSNPPELTEIVPSSGPAGLAYPLHATIRGTGFMATGNLVQFGPVRIPDAASADGSTIELAIPKGVPSRGEVPPRILPPGDYPVSVTTAAGTSNALTFALTRGP
jgi:hypothetical protein